VQIDTTREQANFQKRFKWAFITGYSEAKTLDDDRPVLGKWRRWRNEQEVNVHQQYYWTTTHIIQLRGGGTNPAIENLLHARDAFLRLSRCKPVDTGAIYCKDAYREVQVPSYDYSMITYLCDSQVHDGSGTSMRCQLVQSSEFL
jgi:hypothetical protein